MSEEHVATLLLGLRLRAVATTGALSDAAGLDVATTGATLRWCSTQGWVRHRDGRISGWTLTPSGRRHGQELLAAELVRSDTTTVLLDVYDEFLGLNAELLSICTDWQTVVVAGRYIPNDHADAERDAAVLARLDALHPAAIAAVDRMSTASPRFGDYGRRLDEARRHVTAGRTEWLTRASVDSYHGVWFELHEHLLAALERDREREPIPAHTTTNLHGLSGRPTGATGNGDNR